MSTDSHSAALPLSYGHPQAHWALMDSTAGFEPARACATWVAARHLQPLGNVEKNWRLVQESNPRHPAGQAGTLATELTKQIREKVPVTGSGAAQSLRPVCIARRERTRDGIWRRVRGLNPRCRVENPTSLPARRTRHEDFHFGCAPARALPSEAASRCTRSGFLARTSRAAYTVRLCDDGVQGHTRSERKSKKARILCGIRASGIQSAAKRVSQTRWPPGSRQSSDSRRSSACPIDRGPAHGGTTRTNARKPARAWALR